MNRPHVWKPMTDDDNMLYCECCGCGRAFSQVREEDLDDLRQQSGDELTNRLREAIAAEAIAAEAIAAEAAGDQWDGPGDMGRIAGRDAAGKVTSLEQKYIPPMLSLLGCPGPPQRVG